MQLSDRLEKLMELAGRGVCAADIGTDHAFVPAELVRRGAFSRAVASDVRKGPLKSAEAHIRQAELSLDSAVAELHRTMHYTLRMD